MSANIKKWQERIIGDDRTYAVDAAKNAEIAELRSALDVESAALADAVRHVGNLKDRLKAGHIGDEQYPIKSTHQLSTIPAYEKATSLEREQINKAIETADRLIAESNHRRGGRDRRKLDLPYQANGLPDRRTGDRRK